MEFWEGEGEEEGERESTAQFSIDLHDLFFFPSVFFICFANKHSMKHLNYTIMCELINIEPVYSLGVIQMQAFGHFW